MSNPLKGYDVIKDVLDIEPEEWAVYANSLSKIESNDTYDISGGHNGHYDGKYQLGKSAKIDASRFLKESTEGHGFLDRRAFRKDKDKQERYFAAFTAGNVKTLDRLLGDKFTSLNKEEKLRLLGYAHNQGAGGAIKFVKTGQAKSDAFGTVATKYGDLISENLSKYRNSLPSEGVIAGVEVDDPLSNRPLDASTFVEVDSTKERDNYVAINESREIPREGPVLQSFEKMMQGLADKTPTKTIQPEEQIIPEPQAIAQSETIDASGAASNELEVLQEQDQFVAEAVDADLAKARFAGGRRPAGIGLAEDAVETFEWSGNQSNFEARDVDVRSNLEALTQLSTEGMGEDFGNKVIDKSTLGLIVQNATLAQLTNDEVDENYDPLQEQELYQELTSGLDNEQLKDLLNGYGNNRHDFILAASAMNAQNERRTQMQQYSSEHPVLSGVNSVGVLLGEAAAFSFVASGVSAAASTAIRANAAVELGLASRIALYTGGELVEQGLEELVWAKYDRDYEFDPKVFGLALAAGVGIRNVMHNSQVDKTLRDILNNEGGFIQLSKDRSKSVVDELSKRVTSEKAKALINRLDEKRVVEANRIRKRLVDKQYDLKQEFKKAAIAFKKAKKKTPEKKKLKNLKQNAKRRLDSFEKKYPKEIEQLVNGTHPELLDVLNPNLSIKKVAEGLDIPKDVIKDNQKFRQFLGIDSPDIAGDFIIAGDKSYTNVVNTQLKEMKNNKRLNANETMKYMAEKMGDNFIGNKLFDLASTDGAISKYLFNKGNLVSSENPLTSSFYNWLAPDGMGRTGSSRIRAVESQQKYDNIYGGGLMDLFHLHGDKMYSAMKQQTNRVVGKISSTLDVDDYERQVTDIFKQRLVLGADEFRDRFSKEIADIADGFADDFNKLNESIIKRAEEVGVEGVEFDATKDWFHRSWDYTKARAVKTEDLESSIFDGMKKYLDDIEVKYDADELLQRAKRFTHGIKNADITKVEGAQKGYIEYLTKLANKSEGEAKEAITAEVTRLENNLLKGKQGDLANRAKIDVTVPVKGTDMILADLFEDNFINTQRRYNSRMSARIAAAEHGVKDINVLDDWVKDAHEAEIKRFADKGVENPKQAAQFAKEAMEQDLKSFKNGNITGLGDLQDDNANEFLRFVKKYNFANLMQYVGISSIAELGGTLAEAGVGTTMRQLSGSVLPFYRKMFDDNPELFVDTLYNDMRSFTGIGLEDYAFSTKGTSAGNRIYKDKGLLNTAEKVIDATGRLTQGTFGHIETLGRRVTNNSLGVAWADHFTGKQTSDGILSGFFGGKRVNNRVLENAGLGSFNEANEFVFNDLYGKIKKEILDKAEYDSRGNLINLHMNKWDNDTAHKFGDVIAAQANHIFVNPDSTTMALWQSSTVGQILNQFRTFTINSATKVAAYSVSNAAMGLKRGDAAEAGKLANKVFWGTTLGMMSIMLRDSIRHLGNEDKGGLDLFDEGAMKAAAIGLSRSSIIGQMPTLVDTISGGFGADPFFEKSSSIGRSRDFFNLSTTPTGQAINRVFKGGQSVLQGDVKDGGVQLLKSSPFYRQIGVQQMFNFIQKED